jgi:putative flavoprotein involved in K+ transport
VEQHDVVVIGGGQAGLTTGRALTARGISHVVLERDRVGSSWAGLWDSFCLNTPAWTVSLPEMPPLDADPDAFLTKEEIVAFLEGYAAAIGSPVRAGVEVEELRPRDDGGFRLTTSAGRIDARAIVVATGAFQRPFLPPGLDAVPADVPVLDPRSYRNAAGLPEGRTLVIGAGQSGCQIAEDLLDAGREVVVSYGRAAWAPRRIGEHDVVWWGEWTGFTSQPVEALPSPAARLAANLTVSGVGGGHDLNARTLQARGATLVGHFVGVDASAYRFADDLADNVAWGDARYEEFRSLVLRTCEEREVEPPELPLPGPFDGRAPTSIEAGSIGSVILAGGFRPDYSWIDVAGVVDDMGFPNQREGASTVVPGLSFVGVHFLRTRKSSLLLGVAEDAAIVADGIADHLKR